jgi:hypothetical protein
MRGVNLDQHLKLTVPRDVSTAVVFYVLKRRAIDAKDEAFMTDFLNCAGKGKRGASLEESFRQLQVSRFNFEQL